MSSIKTQRATLAARVRWMLSEHYQLPKHYTPFGGLANGLPRDVLLCMEATWRALFSEEKYEERYRYNLGELKTRLQIMADFLQAVAEEDE